MNPLAIFKDLKERDLETTYPKLNFHDFELTLMVFQNSFCCPFFIMQKYGKEIPNKISALKNVVWARPGPVQDAS